MNPIVLRLNEAADLWWRWIFHAAWQTSLVALLLLAIVVSLKRLPSHLRYGILLLALAKFALPPLLALPSGVFTRWGPVVEGAAASGIATNIEAPVKRLEDRMPSGSGVVAGAAPRVPKTSLEIAGPSREWIAPARSLPADAAPARRPGEADAPRVSSPLVRAAPVTLDWKGALLVLHGVGALLAIAWIAVCLERLRRLKRGCRIATEPALIRAFERAWHRVGASRKPRLLVMRSPSPPISAGVLRPVVLVPEPLVERLPSHALESILAHELLHHRRRDLAVNWIQNLLAVVWWFHPVFWLVAGAVRRVREECCDDRLVDQGLTTRDAYSGALLSVASILTGRAAGGSRLGIASPLHPLGGRVRRILDAGRPRSPRLSRFGWVALVALASLLLPGLRTAHRAEAGETAQPQSIDPESIPLSGSVVAADGNPVAGIEVVVVGGLGSMEILGRTSTDENGAFRTTTSAAALMEPGVHILGFWAYRPGARVGWAWKWLRMEPHRLSEPVTLALRTPEPVRLRVLDSVGSPIVRAKVRAHSVSLDNAVLSLPEELSDPTSVETDEHGMAEITAFTPDEIQMIGFETPEHGRIGMGFETTIEDGVRTYRLRPTGRLTGRVVCDDPQVLSGTTIAIFAGEGGGGGMPHNRVFSSSLSSQRLDATPDAEGRFEAARVQEGTLSVNVNLPEGSPYTAVIASDRNVRAGEETRVEIVLRKGVRVRGTVVEAESGMPIEGVGVFFLGGGHGVTDSEGRFHLFCRPGKGLLSLRPPATHFRSAEWLQPEVSVPEGEADYEFAKIELPRAAIVRCKVVDSEGNPIPLAAVRGAWWLQSAGRRWPMGEAKLSDRNGEFEIGGVDPDAELTLYARVGEANETTMKIVPAKEPGPVTLVVGTPQTRSLEGRVVDTTGKPASGARIEVLWRHRIPVRTDPVISEIEFGDPEVLTTDSEGRYRTPSILSDRGECRVVVRVSGKTVAESDWVDLDKDRVVTLPDIVLAVGSVQGRVVDRAGTPVPGATVYWSAFLAERASTRTDEEGRFTLVRVAEAGPFLFVSKKGFRFHGQAIGEDSDRIECVLTRGNENPTESLRSLPSRLAEGEEHALALSVLEPVVERALASGKEDDRVRPLETLARLDPARVLAVIDAHGFTNPWFNDYLRRAIAKGLLPARPDDALTVVEAMEAPWWRSRGYLDVCEAIPASDRPRKLELLHDSLVNARRAEDPALRLAMLGWVAEALLDLGEREAATEILREGEKLAADLPSADMAGYARAAFAEELAQIDLEAALPLVASLEDSSERTRHYGNMAQELAAIDPPAAERVLRDVRDDFNEYRAKVCYRMAPVDRGRAERIAATIRDPVQRARAFGVMGLALVGSDRERARELLDHAFALLEDSSREADRATTRQQMGYQATFAAALLPLVEAIDPALVSESFWKTLSFAHLSRLPGERTESESMERTAGLATLLARYDPEVARQVLQPLVDPAKRLVASGVYVETRKIFAAASVIDPSWAVTLAQGEAATDSDRMTVAGMLSRHGEERWRYAEGMIGFLWAVDEEDL